MSFGKALRVVSLIIGVLTLFGGLNWLFSSPKKQDISLREGKQTTVERPKEEIMPNNLVEHEVTGAPKKKADMQEFSVQLLASLQKAMQAGGVQNPANPAGTAEQQPIEQLKELIKPETTEELKQRWEKRKEEIEQQVFGKILPKEEAPAAAQPTNLTANEQAALSNGVGR